MKNAGSGCDRAWTTPAMHSSTHRHERGSRRCGMPLPGSASRLKPIMPAWGRRSARGYKTVFWRVECGSSWRRTHSEWGSTNRTCAPWFTGHPLRVSRPGIRRRAAQGGTGHRPGVSCSGIETTSHSTVNWLPLAPRTARCAGRRQPACERPTDCCAHGIAFGRSCCATSVRWGAFPGAVAAVCAALVVTDADPFEVGAERSIFKAASEHSPPGPLVRARCRGLNAALSDSGSPESPEARR